MPESLPPQQPDSNVPPGTISVGGAPGLAVEPSAPIQWLTYDDATFGFSIKYPDTYVIVDKANPRETPDIDLVQQIRFQDKTLANGDTADLEPPQFRIEILKNGAGETLDQWLKSHTITGTQAGVTIGGREGVAITLNTMMAPNQFYYLAYNDYIYRLTPLGVYGNEMLKSFTMM